jgi:hypothetical protein
MRKLTAEEEKVTKMEFTTANSVKHLFLNLIQNSIRELVGQVLMMELKRM